MSYPFSYLTGEVGKLGISKIKRHIVSSNNALVYDTFTNVDGTLLTAHTPDICPVGAVWVEILPGGSSKIIGNKAVLNAGIAETIIESNLSDCNVSALLNNNRSAILFRTTDSGNLWNAINTASGIYLYERTGGGGFVQRGFSAAYLSAGVIRINLNGDAINIYHTENLIITYSSPVRKTVTKHGIYFENTSDYADDFKVETL